MSLPFPLCACGCGRPVKKRVVRRPSGHLSTVRFYDRDCYTRSGERARHVAAHNRRIAFARRTQKLGRFLDRLPVGRVTREDVLAVMAQAVVYFVDLEAAKWKQRLLAAQKRGQAA